MTLIVPLVGLRRDWRYGVTSDGCLGGGEVPRQLEETMLAGEQRYERPMPTVKDSGIAERKSHQQVPP